MRAADAPERAQAGNGKVQKAEDLFPNCSPRAP